MECQTEVPVFLLNGYQLHEGVLSPAACDALPLLEESSRAGARHLMRHPAIAEIAHRERLLSLARGALASPTAVPFRATLFRKTPSANWLVPWHQDTALPIESLADATGWGPWSTKAGIRYARAPRWALERMVALRLHLDAATSENGSLRVLPGSHRLGVLSDEEAAAYAHQHAAQAVTCLSPPGAILAMSPLLLHCSAKATSTAPRRVLHIEYAIAREFSGLRLALA
jgi:ectoine hydroxylase-related dioxygenase (phytanoyl-CoA dioxygenase family)